MGRFQGWLGRLERTASENLESFELLGGTIYYFDRLETYGEVFMHGRDVLLGDASEAKWPEPPEVYRKICEARDPAKALELFMPEDPTRALVVSTAVFDRYALVNERRLVPISYEPPVDLSER
jgi:hypothetical protein